MTDEKTQTYAADYFGVTTRDTFDDALVLVDEIQRRGHVAKVRHGLIKESHYNDWGCIGRWDVRAWIVEEWGRPL